MRLTPTERDRLLLFTAAELSRVRRARGLRLNVPEATALVADTACEVARDGGRLADAIAAAKAVLSTDDVLPGVADLLTEIQVEAVFDDGTRLITLTNPISAGSLGAESPGSVLPSAGSEDGVATRDRRLLLVTNTADVPISITSHFHFFELNPRLRFDRAAAYGQRADIPAGSTVRVEPGDTQEVPLVPIGGARIITGFAGLVDGPLDAPGVREAALARARVCGYLDVRPASYLEKEGR